MIQATVVKVLFSYDFKTKREEVDCVILELPNGMELRAPIKPEHLNYFNEALAKEQYDETMRASGVDPDNIGYVPQNTADRLPDEGAPEAEPPGSSTPLEPEDVKAEETPKQDPTVKWMDLPDAILPDNVKKAMIGIGDLPEELKLSLVTQIRDKITEEFTPQDWAKVGVGDVPVVPVAFGSDARVMVDRGGNPIPKDDESDPGEEVEEEDEAPEF